MVSGQTLTQPAAHRCAEGTVGVGQHPGAVTSGGPRFGPKIVDVMPAYGEGGVNEEGCVNEGGDVKEGRRAGEGQIGGIDQQRRARQLLGRGLSKYLEVFTSKAVSS